MIFLFLTSQYYVSYLRFLDIILATPGNIPTLLRDAYECVHYNIRDLGRTQSWCHGFRSNTSQKCPRLGFISHYYNALDDYHNNGSSRYR